MIDGMPDWAWLVLVIWGVVSVSLYVMDIVDARSYAALVNPQTSAYSTTLDVRHVYLDAADVYVIVGMNQTRVPYDGYTRCDTSPSRIVLIDRDPNRFKEIYYHEKCHLRQNCTISTVTEQFCSAWGKIASIAMPMPELREVPIPVWAAGG